MNTIKGIVFLIAAVAFAGCVREDQQDCRIRVNLQYKYNMLSADAFVEQADRMTLYVFDQEGVLVRKYERQAINTSSIELDPLPSGRYRFVAWGRGSALTDVNADFQIPDMTVGVSRIEELTYRLRTSGGEQQTELNPFLVGVQEADIIERERKTVTIDLKKVTRKIRVVIMPVSAQTEIEASDYTMWIEDPVGNGLINYDFSVLSDAPVTYRPYFYDTVIPADPGSPAPGEVDRAIAAEFSMSRLLPENGARLHITRSDTGAEKVNVNLPWLFSLTGMEEHRNWSLQEYLDRQDEFVITFFLQDETWASATIVINGWVVNNISIED